MKKALPLLLAITLLSAGRAEALDGHLFDPQAGEDKFVTIQSSSLLSSGESQFGFFLDYADTPVEGKVSDRTVRLSEHQLVGTVLAAYGVNDALQLSISIPYLLSQDGVKLDLVSGVSSAELGDIKISAKYRLAQKVSDEFGLALSYFFVFDTGSEGDFFGNNSPSGGVRLVVDKKLNDQTTVAFNLGYQFKDTEVLTPTQKIGDTIFYGVGISHSLDERLFLTGEIYGSTPSHGMDRHLSPLEVNLSLGYEISPGYQLILGAGVGLSSGVGAPQWRVLAGVRFGL